MMNKQKTTIIFAMLLPISLLLSMKVHAGEGEGQTTPAATTEEQTTSYCDENASICKAAKVACGVGQVLLGSVLLCHGTKPVVSYYKNEAPKVDGAENEKMGGFGNTLKAMGKGFFHLPWTTIKEEDAAKGAFNTWTFVAPVTAGVAFTVNGILKVFKAVTGQAEGECQK